VVIEFFVPSIISSESTTAVRFSPPNPPRRHPERIAASFRMNVPDQAGKGTTSSRAASSRLLLAQSAFFSHLLFSRSICETDH